MCPKNACYHTINKKFAPSLDCPYSPPPAAKPFRNNRKFVNSHIDGIDDEDLSGPCGEFLAECSPFLVDRCVFSMGGGDEGDGHSDDHDLLSPASFETVEGGYSWRTLNVSIPSGSSTNPWSFGRGCTGCLNFLERQFEEAKEERKACFFCRGRPALYGHTSSKCPFLDLSIQCQHCKTPGKSLKKSALAF